jgi:hypothetical protein
MSRFAASAALVSAIIVAGPAVAHAQGMMLDFAADKVIQNTRRRPASS